MGVVEAGQGQPPLQVDFSSLLASAGQLCAGGPQTAHKGEAAVFDQSGLGSGLPAVHGANISVVN